MRMRRAHHDVNGIGAALHNRGHGLDHGLDALVGADQAEGENDLTPRKTPALFCRIAISKRLVGDAMGMTQILPGSAL
jgi:hypothetical protein